jgi:hypothetical protein
MESRTRPVDHLTAAHAASIDNAGICYVVPDFGTRGCFEKVRHGMFGSGRALLALKGTAQSPRQHCLNYSQRCVEKRARVGGWRTVRLVPGDTASGPVLRIDTMLQTVSSAQRVEQRDN